jgi:hypothetical protein
MSNLLSGGLTREASNSRPSPAHDYIPAWMLHSDDDMHELETLQRQRASRGLSDEHMMEG